uniref:uncharacterized protein LOC122591006 n=1 Tax=Erigeron canadensis TaxID=72917 RepID=UPI001CB93C08|nr:uncharacterized protein LOC122591006 [Erigeron canadensis]
MNIEIIGRHALLFDDDANAAFVNSDDALVEWNSLLIDRYDVRHLLSTPPPSRRRRNPQTSHSSAADAEIDYERYLDLHSSSDDEQEYAKTEAVGGFNAVPFSYGNYEDSNDQQKAETESEISGFHPPFPVPRSLVQNLPPTKKVHQIIARTALFVSKNGGQSEIVLRVKQGDNPTFGFLMPDHHLHPYFRFLVDHQDLLQSKYEGQDNDKTSNTENAAGAGALSLLGSVYGTGEDEDAGVEHASSPGECVSGNTVDINATMSLATGKTNAAGKDESSKHSLLSNKDAPILKRSSISTASKTGRTSSMNKGESLGSLPAAPDKLRASSLPPIPKTEQMLLDPPSDMKPLVDKIVEFVIKNGRQFEAVLIEQDRGHGRFPFLLSSNIFHPYYLKVLQKAQESKLTIKSFHNEKEESRGNIWNKKTSVSREKRNHLVESDDIPVDPERKEKFKMVINKSKKDGSDLPAKATQPEPRVQVDAAQAAAILQAATRGVNHPSLGILFGQPSNGAKSSEAQMTHEQKLKAERLKRAKMFVAQLKSGAAPLKAEAPRGFSVEPPGTAVDSGLASKDGVRSTIPLKDASERKLKSEKEHLNVERRSKRKYRARGEASEVAEVEEEEEDDNSEVDERDGKKTRRRHTKKHRSRNHSVEADSEDDEREYKHVKRTHRSHRSSHKHDDMDKSKEERDHKSSRKKKHRSPSSYEDDDGHKSDREYSRKKHRSRYSSFDESSDEIDSDHKYSRKKRKHRSHRSSHHSKDRHKDSKRHSSRHRQERDVLSEEESRDHIKADKHKKGSNSEKEELEEGEISSKLSGQSRERPFAKVSSREPSVDISSQDRRPSSQPIDTTEVPEDLRAKIRAMLMSTM